jgi:hypothetical protein
MRKHHMLASTSIEAAYLRGHALDDVSEADTIRQLCANGLVAPLLCQGLALLKRQLADGHGRGIHSCCCRSAEDLRHNEIRAAGQECRKVSEN